MLAFIWIVGVVVAFWNLAAFIDRQAQMDCCCWRAELDLLDTIIRIHLLLFVFTLLVLAACWPVLLLLWPVRWWQYRNALRCVVCGGHAIRREDV